MVVKASIRYLKYSVNSETGQSFFELGSDVKYSSFAEKKRFGHI